MAAITTINTINLLKKGIVDNTGFVNLSGGSTEMSRNIVSERLLGMPREYAADRDVPFNQVKRSAR